MHLGLFIPNYHHMGYLPRKSNKNNSEAVRRPQIAVEKTNGEFKSMSFGEKVSYQVSLLRLLHWTLLPLGALTLAVCIGTWSQTRSQAGGAHPSRVMCASHPPPCLGTPALQNKYLSYEVLLSMSTNVVRNPRVGEKEERLSPEAASHLSEPRGEREAWLK